MSEEDRLIHSTIQSFSYAHQAVYLTYAAHEITGINLPKFLQKELRLHLGITQPTVRFYKKEVKDKIESIKYISQTLKLKP